MSLFFIVNNLVFAFGMVGAIVCTMSAWLSFDAFRLRRDPYVFSRAVGFSFLTVSYLIQALTLGNDILLFVSAVIFGIGLLCLIASFLHKSDLVVHAIIVIPSFSLFSSYIHGVETIAILLIAYFAYRLWKHEQNRTWIPFMVSFLLIGAGSFIAAFITEGDHAHPLFIARLIFEAAGFVILGYWVWQYMRLRINESVMMISVGVTFLLATIVTLAFSTILISRVSAETARNLITDVKVLDLSVTSSKGEALAKARLVAQERDIIDALAKDDPFALDQAATKFLQTYELGFLTVSDPLGNVLVRAHALSRHGDSVSGERAFEEAAEGRIFVTIEEDSVEGLSIRAGAPVYSPGGSSGSPGKFLGVVIAGYPLDNAFVDGMKRVTGLEMFIYKGDTSISGTAFAANGTERLVGVKVSSGSVLSDVLEGGEIVTADALMSGEPFQASYAPIANADGKIIGMLSAAKHQQDIINIANATNRLTLITVILILLVLLAPIYFLAKRLVSESSVN